MLTNSAHQRDIDHIMHPYTNLDMHNKKGPMIIDRSEGIWVYDDQGDAYIEGMSGLWCTSLGYGEKRLADAAHKQMLELPYSHIFAHKSHLPAIDLATKIVEKAPVPMSKVFFASSGSEAVDTAIKIIWYYHNAIGKPKKKKILSRMNGYHGVTVAGASLTGLKPLHVDFDLPAIDVHHLSSPHFFRHALENESEEEFATRLAKELEDVIAREGAENIGAMIAEPVMGAGGVILPPKTYFDKIQPILKEHDILLVADEVICGFGRTGSFWGSQTYDIKPDMITMAKQLSSGYIPISAVMINEKVSDAVVKNAGKLGTFGTGYTYSGHPVAAAVALETLAIYEERSIVEHVNSLSPIVEKFLHMIKDHPQVGHARAQGLIGAVELIKNKKNKEFYDPKEMIAVKCAKIAEEEGLIVRPLPHDSVAFCPPLIIKEDELTMMFDRLTKSIDRLHKETL